MRRAKWFKSSRSGNDPTCVEVAFLNGFVAVRDSKHTAGPVDWTATLVRSSGCY
ncbi:MAG: DUF397 domain-containing protein [Sciscionella sp.]